MNNKPLRLGIVVSHPIQYFAPVYRKIAADPGVELTVFFESRVGVDGYFDPGFSQLVKWDIPLLEGYRSVFLSHSTKSKLCRWNVAWEIARVRPEVVLFHGYTRPTNLVGLFVCKMLGIKSLMRGDSKLTRNGGSSIWRYWVKSVLFRAVDGFVAIGSENKMYYSTHGVPGAKLYFAPFSVDNERFGAGDARPTLRDAVRAEMEIPADRAMVLFVAKLTSRKRPRDLLEAGALLAKEGLRPIFVMAGAGPEENSLREYAHQAGVDARFPGFVNQSRLPRLYAAADIFVLPSANEPWGLVINEAMAAGLPVITTDDVGAAADLVANKGTGYVYRAGDVSALAGALAESLSSPGLLAEMGRAATSLISEWDVAPSARAIRDAALAVAGKTMVAK